MILGGDFFENARREGLSDNYVMGEAREGGLRKKYVRGEGGSYMVLLY